MGFKKEDTVAQEARGFSTFLEAREVFENKNAESDERIRALGYIIDHNEIHYVLSVMASLFELNDTKDHPFIDYAFAGFSVKPKREEDFHKLFEMLQSDNAYLRNATIGFLQTYGTEAKPYIEELMQSNDRDLRIFAINILGDVKYEDSVKMLRYFLAKESDINVLMSAVDYLGEIGETQDIALLRAVEKEHPDDPYVAFGVSVAINRIKANDND